VYICSYKLHINRATGSGTYPYEKYSQLLFQNPVCYEKVWTPPLDHSGCLHHTRLQSGEMQSLTSQQRHSRGPFVRSGILVRCHGAAFSLYFRLLCFYDSLCAERWEVRERHDLYGLQIEHYYGFNLFKSLLGSFSGSIAWFVALIVTWGLSGLGFYSIYKASKGA
jgi:hypothetical protein